MRGLVSVVMPTFNCSDYVEEAVMSVLEQTYSNLELIVVDDGSCDETYEVVSRIDDRRLRLVQNSCNKGISAALNRGVEISRGEFIARMDGDDISDPRRLQRQLDYMNEAEVDCVGSWIRTFGYQNELWKTFEHSEDLKFMLNFYSPVFHATMLFKSDVLKRYRYDSKYDGIEDYELWTRMFKDGVKFSHVQEVLYFYRIGRSNSEKRGTSVMIDLKFELLHAYSENKILSKSTVKLLTFFTGCKKLSILEIFEVLNYLVFMLYKQGYSTQRDRLLYRFIGNYLRNQSGLLETALIRLLYKAMKAKCRLIS